MTDQAISRPHSQADSELQNPLHEWAMLYAFAETMNHIFDLAKIAELALETAVETAGMDSGGLLLLNPSTNELFLRAHRGCSPELIRAVSYTKADEGLMPRMLESVLVISDLSAVTEKRRVVMERVGLRSLVSIPLVSSGGPQGVMVVASPERRTFTSGELRLLAAMGRHVGSAIQRIHLQTQELRTAILEERQAMARQMHDDIAQTLGYLGLQVDKLMDDPTLVQSAQVQAELEAIREAIDKAYQRVRASIIRLSRDIPDRFDLPTALQEMIGEFEKLTERKVRIETQVDWLVPLSPLAAIQVTYIIHEALANISKHAGADRVHLALQRLEDGMIEIAVQDNGRGFDVDSTSRLNGGGFGLRFMAERAERAGGTFRVETRPGQGARIVVRLPSG